MNYSKKAHMSTAALKDIIMKDARAHKKLREIVIEITDKCNYRCKFCYVHDATSKFMPIDTYKKIVDEAKKLGCIWLTITGGEPLLHPFFKEMVDYASNCFSQITIFTNASLLNEETVRLLKNKNVSIEISLYGYNERTYDQYVGVNGMFPKFEKGLSLLKQSCVHYLLKTSITKSNVKIVDELEKYAEQWCVDYKYDPTTLIRMTPGEKQDSYDERLSPYSTARLLMMHQGISEEVKRLYNQDKKCNELYDCNGGESTCLISCDLHMSYCVAVRNPYYDLNISGRSLQEGLIWLQNQKKAFLTKDDKCYDCRLRSICRYCPGRFEVETGNARVPPEWNCEFGNILLNLAINND